MLEGVGLALLVPVARDRYEFATTPQVVVVPIFDAAVSPDQSGTQLRRGCAIHLAA